MQETNPFEEEKADAIHHAGDKSFKTMMKQKESALELVEKFAPEIYEQLDVENFELDDTNYVNKDFEEYYSDVVYRTRLKKNPAKITDAIAVALLFEHKKSIRSYFRLFLQLLEYITFIWREDLANDRPPSVIVPIVVFQGIKGLKIKELHDCFKGVPQVLLQYIPNLRYHLTNVHDLSDNTLLGLNEKNYLRSLFLAYTFTEKKQQIKNMLIEVFKFFKHRTDDMNFFEMMFAFLSQEDYLEPDDVKELLEHYLSPQQKEGIMMTTYESWTTAGRQQGLQQGLQQKARLSVLRGKWHNWSAEALADQAELPLFEVNNLLKGYEQVYTLWAKNKGKTPDVLPQIVHLSEQEVSYLMTFFSQKQKAASEA
jgi:hypothetical protein